jgi:undecaprenyl-phosphate 4-deoxy-4-formamido-L-arabinose transferase
LNKAETPSLSIIIPVYQAEGHIGHFITEIISTLPFGHLEIICVDDSSTDNTWSEITQLSIKDERIKPFRLKKNVGQHRALLYGISQARMEYILTIDDDMLHNLDGILRFVRSAILLKKQLIYARFNRKYEAGWRTTASNSLTQLLKNFSPLIEGASQIRLISREVQVQLSQQPLDRFVFLDCLLPQLTSEIGFTDFDYNPNSASRYSFSQLVSMSSQIVLHYTNLPFFLLLLFGSTLLSLGLWIPFYPLCIGGLIIIFAKKIVHKLRRVSNRKLTRLELAA